MGCRPTRHAKRPILGQKLRHRHERASGYESRSGPSTGPQDASLCSSARPPSAVGAADQLSLKKPLFVEVGCTTVLLARAAAPGPVYVSVPPPVVVNVPLPSTRPEPRL